MIVIVEGIDRVGKSTLCEMIQKDLGLTKFRHIDMFERKKGFEDKEADVMLQLAGACKRLEANIVFDRFHLSEYVYGVVDRGSDTKHAYENFRIVENELPLKPNYQNGYDAILVMVTPNNIELSSKEHGEDLSPYYAMFEGIYEISKLRKVKVNYDNLHDAVDFIRDNWKI